MPTDAVSFILGRYQCDAHSHIEGAEHVLVVYVAVTPKGLENLRYPDMFKIDSRSGLYGQDAI
ncbi:hypothetical protein D3C71_1882410 [compost metagenome]